MADYVTLVGAEDVQRAAHSMRAAADDMKQSAEWIDGALARHQRFLDDWLDRFTAAIERLAPIAILDREAHREAVAYLEQQKQNRKGST